MSDNGWRLEDVYVTELGHIMVKIFIVKDKRWVTYNFGNIFERLGKIEIPDDKIKGR